MVSSNRNLSGLIAKTQKMYASGFLKQCLAKENKSSLVFLLFKEKKFQEHRGSKISIF